MLLFVAELIVLNAPIPWRAISISNEEDTEEREKNSVRHFTGEVVIHENPFQMDCAMPQQGPYL